MIINVQYYNGTWNISYTFDVIYLLYIFFIYNGIYYNIFRDYTQYQFNELYISLSNIKHS